MAHLDSAAGFRAALLALGMVLLSACGSTPAKGTAQGGEKLRVVATTTIVGDVVHQVGGDLIELNVLMPPGTDPHSYQPAPRDLAQVANAELVFLNGAGLEEGYLNTLIQNAGGQAEIINTSEGIELRNFTPGEQAVGEEHGGDPHVWMDPNNVMVWVENIQKALSRLDPQHTSTYEANAQAYQQQLKALDSWITEQVAAVPEQNRKIVTDHLVMGYFAERYGFEQVGAIFPGYTTTSAPSAQDVAQLEDNIRKLGVKAVFVGNTVNPQVAEQVAGDTGVQLVFFYTGALTKGEPAATYLDYMHYNVNAIVKALQ